MNIILPLPIVKYTHEGLSFDGKPSPDNIFFTEKKKNIIIDGIFTKILYSNPNFTMTGLYIQFQICSKFLPDDISTDNSFVRTPITKQEQGGTTCVGVLTPSKDNLAYKTNMQFNPFIEQNNTQIESICKIETHILNLYSRTQFIDQTKTPVYGLATQLYSGCIRAFSIDFAYDGLPSKDNESDAKRIGFLTKYIKISGVWENDKSYGITYKVFME